MKIYKKLTTSQQLTRHNQLQRSREILANCCCHQRVVAEISQRRIFHRESQIIRIDFHVVLSSIHDVLVTWDLLVVRVVDEESGRRVGRVFDLEDSLLLSTLSFDDRVDGFQINDRFTHKFYRRGCGIGVIVRVHHRALVVAVVSRFDTLMDCQVQVRSLPIVLFVLKFGNCHIIACLCDHSVFGESGGVQNSAVFHLNMTRQSEIISFGREELGIACYVRSR